MAENPSDQEVHKWRTMLQRLPPGHPDRSNFLHYLATALQGQFGKQGLIGALDEAITLFSQALDLRPEGHPERSNTLINLGSALVARFGQLGNLADLDSAIGHNREALGLLPHGHLYHIGSLNNLADALSTRFKSRGDMKDLDEAIIRNREALGLSTQGHRLHSMSLNNLAGSLQTRFQQKGAGEDLDEAIILFQQALDQHPAGHPSRTAYLSNLAVTLLTRFRKQGDLKDLDQAITYHCQALDLRPMGHPLRCRSLMNLASALGVRFGERGDVGDLDNAIKYNHEVLGLCPPGHPLHPGALNNLATALGVRFGKLGELDDLNEAIKHHHHALELLPAGSPDRFLSLNNLAAALQARFKEKGDLGDLDQAITYYQQVLALCPPGHHSHGMSLQNLAAGLQIRFEQQGKMKDLDEALGYLHQALALYAPGQRGYSRLLNNLARALGTHFKETGDLKDLDSAIKYHSQALDLHPAGHPDHGMSLHNLSVALATRFTHQGDPKDVEEAIIYQRQALDVIHPRHPDYSMFLNQLAQVLWTRFKEQRGMQDLDEAVSHHYQALSLRPPGHPERFRSITNLATCLQTRFLRQNNLGDLDEAIVQHTQALQLCPAGHPDHPMCLNSLANSLLIRFQVQRDKNDLDYAIQTYKAAFTLPPHHPQHSLAALGLAQAYLSQQQQDIDLAKVFSLFKQAAGHEAAGTRACLHASIIWALMAHEHSHDSEELAYATSLDLLHQYIALSPFIHSQLAVLSIVPPSLATDAAACAIKNGELGRAVEFLEHGRTILWSSMNGLRSPIMDLHDAGYGKLASDFQRLGHQLEIAVTSQEVYGQPRTPLEDEARRYHLFSEERTKVITQIQQLPGFSHFLKAVPFKELQTVASGGPVIVVNISRYSSQALIVQKSGEPTLVPLPHATFGAVRSLSADLSVLLEKGLDERPQFRNRLLVKLLRSLWHSVVHPVVDKLTGMDLPQGSRIWWCPTSALCLLPLHAAGLWNGKAKNLPDLFLSSYTPTLSALLQARAIRSVPAPPSLLVIGVPQPAGDTHKLDNVEVELLQISKVASSNAQQVSIVEGEKATKDAVLQNLQKHSWVHFSCHGCQNVNNPFQSHFRLYDAPLSLQEIIQAWNPDAQLAVLSACHGATGYKRVADEVIHLAAGMQFSGFRSVVGTLWPMDDQDGPLLAKRFYEHMFRNGGKEADHQDAVMGLKVAVDALRSEGVPMERWVNFIHIGA